jgi:serine/threonine-protein kinase SRPK3
MKETDDLSHAPGTLIRIPALKVTSLEDMIDGEEAVFQRPTDMEKEEVPAFASFLRSALSLDPNRRGTAAELLQHEWLRT